MTSSTTVAIIDLSGIFWRAWHASKNEEVSEAYDNTVSRVRSIAMDHDGAVIALDAGGKTFRHMLWEGYKANREEKDQASIAELRRTIERLKADGFLCQFAPLQEADDVIGALVGDAYANGIEPVVYSGDKDMLQCDCTVIDPWSNRPRDREVPAKQYADYLALVGDSADAFPGIKGVGPKAAKWLLDTYGSVEEAAKARDAERDPKSVEAKFWTSAKGQALSEAIDSGFMATMQRLARLNTELEIKVNWDTVLQPREEQPLIEEAEYEEPEAQPAKEDVQPQPQPQPEPEPETHALATVDNLRPVSLLQPLSLRDVGPLAASMFNSRLYTKFPNAQAIAAVIIRGSELGLGAAASLDAFHVIKGMPVLTAHAIIGLAKRHPDCEYFMLVESSAKSATYEGKRRGDPKPTRITYTVEDAKAAGLLGNDQWKKRPAEMLRKTAGVQLSRVLFPEVMLYSLEEMEAV